MQTDSGLTPNLLAYLYALEVQYLIENHQVDGLMDIQQVYDIPGEAASSIVESLCSRYISQLLNLALRTARRYEEADCVKWVKEILKYAIYVTQPVDADGNLFNEDDKKRLIDFYLSDLEAVSTLSKSAATTSEESKDGDNYDDTADFSNKEVIAQRLQALISITDRYEAPQQGIAGLVSHVKTLDEVGFNPEKKSWAWN
jgi:hypothetical protein